MDDFETVNEIHSSVPEHQVLISFNNDEDAEKFEEWFNGIGKYSFVDWCNIPDFKISDDFKVAAEPKFNKDYFG